MSELPLAGIRVVDLTQMLAGPYVTMLLADMGADVIKVESPDGDFIRKQGPFTEDDDLRAFGGYFQSINRNKRSVVLDLRSPQGRSDLERLVASTDVVVENFRNGVMERLGLPYERLCEVNPRIVYAAVRGFGDSRTGEGPLTSWPAYDLTAQAMSGLMHTTGEADGPPTKVGPGIGDTIPALFCLAGLLAALVKSKTTGEGSFVDVAMYDAMLAICERQIYQYSYTGNVAGRHGGTHPLLSPFDVLECADGWVTIAAPNDGLWAKLCAAIGRAELAEDARTAKSVDRVANSAFVHDVLQGWTGPRTKSQIAGELGGIVPIGPVNTVEDIFADPHVHARSMLVTVEQPGSARDVTIAGRPIKFLGVEERPAVRAPLLGEHTAEVLAELDARH